MCPCRLCDIILLCCWKMDHRKCSADCRSEVFLGLLVRLKLWSGTFWDGLGTLNTMIIETWRLLGWNLNAKVVKHLGRICETASGNWIYMVWVFCNFLQNPSMPTDRKLSDSRGFNLWWFGDQTIIFGQVSSTLKLWEEYEISSP